MKISNTQLYINQSYNTSTTAPKKAKEDTVAGDSISLSSTTLDLQKISAAAKAEQPDRVKLVEDLKQQIETNQYTVNADQLADKILTGALVNELG